MIKLVVEKGVPIPEQPEYRKRSGRPQKYDWSMLREPGDSALVPTKADARAANAWAARNGAVVTCEKRVQPGGERGWRVWRIK